MGPAKLPAVEQSLYRKDAEVADIASNPLGNLDDFLAVLRMFWPEAGLDWHRGNAEAMMAFESPYESGW
jgi:hypothetical protein